MKRSSTSSSESRRIVWPLVATLVATVAAYALLERGTLPGAWNAPHAEIVFLGTSHTFDAIDPAAFSRPVGRITFADLDLQLGARTFENHRRRFPSIERLVVEVDEFSLLTDRVSDLRFDLGQLSGELHLWSPVFPDRRPVWRRRAWRLRALLDGDGMPGLYWRRRPTLARLLERRDPIEEAPFAEPVVDPTAGDAPPEARARRRVIRLQALAGSDPEPEPNLRALEALIRRSKTEGLPVTLVSYPLHPAYWAARPPQWERVVEEAVRRAYAVSGDLVHLDYRAEHGLPDTAFKNVDHLSPSGSRVLSVRLRGDLEGR